MAITNSRWRASSAPSSTCLLLPLYHITNSATVLAHADTARWQQTLHSDSPPAWSVSMSNEKHTPIVCPMLTHALSKYPEIRRETGETFWSVFTSNELKCTKAVKLRMDEFYSVVINRSRLSRIASLSHAGSLFRRKWYQFRRRLPVQIAAQMHARISNCMRAYA